LNNGGMTYDIGKDFVKIITSYFVPAIAIVAVLWCVWVGIQFAMAKDETGRRNAKKRFANAVAVVLIFVMMTSVMFTIGLTLSSGALIIDQGESHYSPGQGGNYSDTWVPPGSSAAMPTIPKQKASFGLYSPIQFAGGMDENSRILVDPNDGVETDGG